MNQASTTWELTKANETTKNDTELDERIRPFSSAGRATDL